MLHTHTLFVPHKLYCYFVQSTISFLYHMQGDILFLHMSKDPIRAGEIVVFNVDVSVLSVVMIFNERVRLMHVGGFTICWNRMPALQ